MPHNRIPARRPADLSAPEQRLLALLNARDQLDRHSAHQVDARIPAPGPGPVPDGAAMPPPGRDDAGRRRAGRS